MAATGPEPALPSTTEDVPAAPGWVEVGVDEVLRCLPQEPALATLRNAYLDCLAGARGPDDLNAAHDRCRSTLLDGLRARLRLDDALLRPIEQRLEALEADLTDRL